VVDRVGRKPLLIVGALIMGASMLVIGSLFETGTPGGAGLIAVCCYLAGLGMSFGPIIWILMSELFPAPIRPQAMSLAIAAQWGANFFVSASFPVFPPGGFAFFVYGAFGLLAAFVVLRYVPETKGLDLESMGAFWRRQAGASPAPAS
jgi:MFS transporter, SP family, xylose:H+ symportor